MFVLLLAVLTAFRVGAQDIAMPGFTGVTDITVPDDGPNYSGYSPRTRAIDKVWLKYNSRYREHPDAGYISPEHPEGNVIEIIEKRTVSGRFYVDADNPGRVFSQSAYGALHYREGDRWLLIDHRLYPQSLHVTEASRQPEPVGFDFSKSKSYIRTIHGKVYFNDWKLYGKKKRKNVLLAAADWSEATAGDDGVYIRNLFPGVDAEMQVLRGRIKTNLIVRKWDFEKYDSYVVSDTYEAGEQAGLSFTEPGEKGPKVGTLDLKNGPDLLLRIGKALMYPQSDASGAVLLPYEIAGNESGIVFSEELLRSLLSKGAVVLDPLVTGSATLAQAGALPSYNHADCSYGFSEECSFKWQAVVPARITVTDMIFTATLTTLAPCTRDKMRFRYAIGDTLCGRRITWFTEGLPATPGNTGSGRYSTTLYNNCIRPQCTESTVDISLSILRGCMGPEGCEATCVQGTGPFTVTIEGRTLELTSATASTAVPVCPGEAVTLTATAGFGLPEYAYTWAPGGLNGRESVVRPVENTDYTVTVTDACGERATRTVSVQVRPELPPPDVSIQLVSAPPVCEGTAVTFASELNNVRAAAYQWHLNGLEVNGASQSGFSPTGLKDGDLVRLRVIDREACPGPVEAVSNEIRVEVKPSLVPSVEIRSTPGTPEVCKGTKLTFTAALKNEGDSPMLTWLKNDTPLGISGTEFTADDLADGDRIRFQLGPSETCVTSAQVESNEIRVRINAPKEAEVTQYLCPGALPFVWNGQVLTTGGPRSAVFMMPSLETGCDSTTVLHLVVSAPASAEALSLSGCGTVTYEGKIYTQSQVLADTLRNGYGCDSIYREVSFHVLREEGETVDLSFSGCNSLEFEGQVYYADTLFRDIILNRLGCDSLRRTIAIRVEHFELALSGVMPSLLYEGDAVELRAEANHDDFRITAWEPASVFSGNTGKTQQIQASAGETYTVYGETAQGCTDSASIFIAGKEMPQGTFYPAAFSPNGDGVNDRWKPVRQAAQLEVWVYNRWGACVFHGTDATGEWDGTFKGTRVPAGTYAYKLKIDGRFYLDGAVTVTY